MSLTGKLTSKPKDRRNAESCQPQSHHGTLIGTVRNRLTLGWVGVGTGKGSRASRSQRDAWLSLGRGRFYADGAAIPEACRFAVAPARKVSHPPNEFNHRPGGPVYGGMALERDKEERRIELPSERMQRESCLSGRLALTNAAP